MDREVAKAINDVSKKINAVQQQLDQFIVSLSEKNKADIDFVAMMADVDLTVGEEDETIPEESEVEADE